MKITITGHTAGIGNAITSWMTNHGHQVQGFSRSNGYNINDDNVLERILAESVDADIFINNAYAEFQQTKLLYMFHKLWKDQHKSIINIASARTQRYTYDHFQRTSTPDYYVASKISLDYGCRELWNYSSWPRVMLVKPCGVNTAWLAGHPTPNQVAPDDMADMICSAIFETRCRVQELSFEKNQG